MEQNSLKKSLLAGLSIAALSVAVSSISIASKPKTVELSIDNEQIKLETSAKNVSEVLEGIGYKYIEGSKINYSLEDNIKDKMKIEIDTEKKINFSNGGHLIKVNTFADTVEELLKEENIKLDDNDIVSPSLSTNLKEVKSVNVDYYEEETFTKKEVVKFEKKTQATMDLNYGTKKVSKKGQNGEKTITFEKTIKNGALLETNKVDEKITKKPVAQVTLVGQRLVEDKVIQNKTINKNDATIYKGSSEVVQEGQTGLIRRVYKYDGKKKVLVSEKKVRDAKDRIVKVGTKARPVIAQTSQSSAGLYSLGDIMFHGVINWGGYKYTYYSQSVLPGGGLAIPGRHINAGGFVADADGYIVLANDRPKGTVLPTPFGYMGKVYDRGTYGNHIDVYTR